MKKVSLFMAVIFLLSVAGAMAQLDLGSVKSKVKNKIKEKTEKKTEQKQDDNSSNNNVTKKTNSNNNGENEDEGLQTVKDYGMTDGIHAKHIKQVVFSKTPIRFKEGREEQLANNFVFGDDIYFMAYFEKSYYNQAITDKQNELLKSFWAKEVIWFEVNGEVVGKNMTNSYVCHMYNAYDDHFREWTGLSFPDRSFAKGDTHSKGAPQLAFNTYVVPALKQGENTIKMFVSFEMIQSKVVGTATEHLSDDQLKKYSPAQPMAVGEFKVVVNNIADVKRHIQSNGMVSKSYQNNPALE